MPTAVQEACVEAKSQLLASGVGEIDTEPPSLAYNDDFRNAEHVELPPSPVEEDHPPLAAEEDLSSLSEDEDCPPSVGDDDLLPTRPDEVHNLNPHHDAGRLPA